jgi:hypothetical protein
MANVNQIQINKTMEMLNFSFEQPRVRFIEIDVTAFPEGRYFFCFVLKRCVLTDLLQWKINLGKNSTWRISMHPDGLCEVISTWSVEVKTTICKPACMELHTAIACIFAEMFHDKSSIKQLCQTAKDFIHAHRSIIES